MEIPSQLTEFQSYSDYGSSVEFKIDKIFKRIHSHVPQEMEYSSSLWNSSSFLG